MSPKKILAFLVAASLPAVAHADISIPNRPTAKSVIIVRGEVDVCLEGSDVAGLAAEIRKMIQDATNGGKESLYVKTGEFVFNLEACEEAADQNDFSPMLAYHACKIRQMEAGTHVKPYDMVRAPFILSPASQKGRTVCIAVKSK